MPCQVKSYFKSSLCLLFGHFWDLNKAALGFFSTRLQWTHYKGGLLNVNVIIFIFIFFKCRNLDRVEIVSSI